MTGPRLALLVALASAPLLLVALSAGGAPAVAVAAWAVAVAAAAAVLWVGVVRPQADLARELGAGADPVTSARELQQRLTEAEAQRGELAHLVEDLSGGLGEGLVVVDGHLRVRLINPVARRFLGSERVPAGTHLLDVLRMPNVLEAVRGAAAGGRPELVIVENPRGLWEVRAFPIRQGGAVVLLADVGLVRRSAEFRRRFVQDLSHELRSPLAVLRTTVEALEGEVGDALASRLVRQVERLTRLTDELYELASIEAGQVELRPELHRLVGIVREVADDFRVPAESAGVDLRLDVPEELYCTCDRRGLYRVLSNLVDNAIKYNRREGWVEVRGWTSSDAVHLQVSDSGRGIPSSELKAVMQRFYRLDQARTPGEGGLGLGLAIVKHMVQHMGGALDLDSREGLGTRVTLTFPTRPGIATVAPG